jgi:hypothetical protein
VSSPKVEAFLARIYVKTRDRQAFLADPVGEARRAGLTPAEAAALAAVDREGLALAAKSFGAKRRGGRPGEGAGRPAPKPEAP